MKYLTRYLKKYARESFLAPLFKMLEAVFDLLVPYIIADMIRIGVGNQDMSYIWKKTGLLIFMTLLGFLCSSVAQYFSAKVACETSAGLRHDLFEKIQSFGYKEIDTVSTSTLITRMSSDINQVQNGLNLFLRLFLRSPFIVFGALFMAIRMSSESSWIFILVIAVLFAIVTYIFKATNPMYKENQSRLDHLTTLTRENLEGARVVRAFSREEKEVEQFKKASADYLDAQLKVGNLSAISNPLTYTITNLGIVALVYFGAQYVHIGILESAAVIALINYMSQILVELVKLANLIVTISRAIASMQRIEQVLDMQTKMVYGQERVEAFEETVSFEHVSFQYYSDAEEALEDISFSVRKNETVGIIGSTGSGKSSLVHLICRFYDASAGKISLFEKPIVSYSLDALRDSIAIATQDVQLFSGTIRSNLLWGKADASEAEIERALRIAQAWDFVNLKENGLDSVVEQGGRNLSGGQRQRISIARAILHQSPILILDDTSSALDYQTDFYLRKALKEIQATVFIVSQRTSSIQHCDQILVLDEGKLVGKGKHEELLENCEVYKEIYESQFQKGKQE